MTRYVERRDPDGKLRRIAVVDGTPPDVSSKKRKREPFKPKFVQVPRQWVEALERAKRTSTYRLALILLNEAFIREQTGGDEIVLSSTVTKMPRNTKMRAIKEMVELGLIKIEQNGRQSPRVSHIYKNH
jgi:hypothetical protein